MADPYELAAAISRCLEPTDDDVSASDLLSNYFRSPVGAERGFTGRHFERVDGGGDRSGVRDSVTAADLVAIQMLSVTFPAEASMEVLHGQLGQELSELLREIPADASLADPVAGELVGPGSSADVAWTLLNKQYDVGWVIAGKLLARKRPHLIPVYDAVVKCALGNPTAFWVSLHEVLVNDAAGIRSTLHALRDEVRLPPEVSDLRVLDVVIWMRHHDAHRKGECAQASQV